MASARSAPHMPGVGRRLTQTAGRSGRQKRAQRKSGSSCTQGIPAGLPWGMPGIGEEIEGAMQHAPQSGRQSMGKPPQIQGRRRSDRGSHTGFHAQQAAGQSVQTHRPARG